MSKYADIEQIKDVIRTEWVKYMPMELDVSLSFVLGKISDVPTIEVSEDCISRADLLQQMNLDAYGNEGQYGDEWKFLDTIENMPRVIPTTEKSSMVGEWLPIVEATEMGEPYIAGIYCSACGETLRHEANYCPNCGAKMKG